MAEYQGDNPEIEKMVAEYDLATVVAAFNIAQHIGREGYAGIHYMEQAEQKLKREAPMVTWTKLDKHMKKHLRSKNLGG